MTDGEEPAVKLKGVGDGFWVTLDPTAPDDQLKSEMEKLFTRLKHLTVNAKVVIDTGDAKGCDELVQDMGTYLKTKFGIGLVTRPPEKRSVPVERIRQRDLSKDWTHHRSNVLMLRGRVRSGQKIKAKKHIIITGDVNPGAEILAGGDIYILGKLLGQVHAGQHDNNDAIVFALDFRPSQIQIGTILATGLDQDRNQNAEFAFVNKNKIVVQDYLKTSPFGRIPWPEVI
ncbi:MAG: septum site-determining protein MinC [Thermodesulfobacteriota bacterium]|nr:septum site-determining protein MinC [Thermodesulfobacteriota bacterium]